ncbi:hypothetical protein SAMN05428977_10088 [Nitrosomonas sp. Nm166]|nr:hypothetical protein SAMN05428977_10088 [Nitrosomonas sp. Nm166]
MALWLCMNFINKLLKINNNYRFRNIIKSLLLRLIDKKHFKIKNCEGKIKWQISVGAILIF